MKNGTMIVRNTLWSLLLVFGLSWQASGQTPAKGIEGSWYGTLEAGATKLPLIVTVTRSESGVYTGKFESPAQGASIPLDSISLRGDDVTLGSKAAGIAYAGVLNKDHTELVGTFNQGGQAIPLNFTRNEPAAAAKPSPVPKPDYSAPTDAPYTAEEVLVKTPEDENARPN